VRITWFLALAAALASAPAFAQSHCADCHYARLGAPWPAHLTDWELSAHGKSGVGCEKCHGGDASTFEPFLAHQGVLNSSNPASPTHRQNIPKTCGGCHPGPDVAFQGSKHNQLLRSGDAQAPTCLTCHDPVAAHLLSPKALAGTCNGCHGEGKTAARPERAAGAKLLLEEVYATREQLKAAHTLIRRVPDAGRRHRLEEAYEQAQVPLTQAVHAGHRFVFDDLEERLAMAKRRTEALLAELANPTKQ
jgi:hypothetical protein